MALFLVFTYDAAKSLFLFFTYDAAKSLFLFFTYDARKSLFLFFTYVAPKSLFLFFTYDAAKSLFLFFTYDAAKSLLLIFTYDAAKSLFLFFTYVVCCYDAAKSLFLFFTYDAAKSLFLFFTYDTAKSLFLFFTYDAAKSLLCVTSLSLHAHRFVYLTLIDFWHQFCTQRCMALYISYIVAHIEAGCKWVPISYFFSLWKPRNERNYASNKKSRLKGKRSAALLKWPTVMKELRPLFSPLCSERLAWASVHAAVWSLFTSLCMCVRARVCACMQFI